jgi:hypothetical protein
MSAMVKQGAITVGLGIASVLCSALFGFGPCGPASIPGALLFYGGFLGDLDRLLDVRSRLTDQAHSAHTTAAESEA